MRGGWGPALVVATIGVPVAAGLLGTALPAFGYLPALGGMDISLDPWRAALAMPGLPRSIAVTLLTGLGATIASLALTIAIAASFHGTRPMAVLRRALGPLLAIPHAAFAIGLSILIAPSGWVIRLMATAGLPITRPPDLLIVHDRFGLAMTAALILKETAFLVLVLLAALPQAGADRAFLLARTLGYAPAAAWLKAVLPRVYPQMRLPVLAVLSASLSVVDVALILGPTTPSTLPVLILKTFDDPDLRQHCVAAALALMQLGLVAAAVLVWVGLERRLAGLLRRWRENGQRTFCDAPLRAITGILSSLAAGVVVLLVAALVLWSFADVWRFPDAWPSSLTLATWRGQGTDALGSGLVTLALACLSALIALAIVVACLEGERRASRPSGWLISKSEISDPSDVQPAPLLPLAGEGGRRSRTDEECRGRSPPRRSVRSPWSEAGRLTRGPHVACPHPSGSARHLLPQAGEGADGAFERSKMSAIILRSAEWLLYAPLVVPQSAFLFGFDVVLALLGLNGGFAEVLVAHLLFVLPYVHLALADSWRAFDDRYRRTALCLGASPRRILWRVRLPILLKPVLTAAAIGFAVSVGLYLPTMLAGGGRIETLTTEAVSLSSGGDRRLIAATALLQMLLPAIGFGLALGLPRLFRGGRR